MSGNTYIGLVIVIMILLFILMAVGPLFSI